MSRPIVKSLCIYESVTFQIAGYNNRIVLRRHGSFEGYLDKPKLT